MFSTLDILTASLFLTAAPRLLLLLELEIDELPGIVTIYHKAALKGEWLELMESKFWRPAVSPRPILGKRKEQSKSGNPMWGFVSVLMSVPG